MTGCTQAVRHDIETNGARPVRCGPRRRAPTGLRTEQEGIKDMLVGQIDGGGFLGTYCGSSRVGLLPGETISSSGMSPVWLNKCANLLAFWDIIAVSFKTY